MLPNIEYIPGLEKPGGWARNDIIVVRAQDVLLNDFPDRDADNITISSVLPMKPGTYAALVYHTEDSGIATATGQGEMKGISFQSSVTWHTPFLASKSARNFLRQVSNQEIFVFVKDCDMNEWKLLGDACRQLSIDAGNTVLTTGEDGTPASRAGITYAFIGGVAVPAVYALDPNGLLLESPMQTAPTVITSVGATLNWQEVSGVDGYYIDVSSQEDFSVLEVDSKQIIGGAVISDVIGGLTANTTYYTRIRSYIGTYESANSNSQTFTTLP